MARERFRVKARDAHFNGEERTFTHPADDENALRASLAEHAPHLTIVQVKPYERALREELRDLGAKARVAPTLDAIGQEAVRERLHCCVDLANLFGPESQENLINVLSRFCGAGSSTLSGLESLPFSFCFYYGGDDRPVHGGFIFHESLKQWGTHT